MIDCRMYYDVLGRSRLFWQCDVCGLEWRGKTGEPRSECPRCELNHAKVACEVYGRGILAALGEANAPDGENSPRHAYDP